MDDVERRPQARAEGLIAEELDGELLIYDQEIDTAHSLDRDAARIWRGCDGERTIAELASGCGLAESVVLDTTARLGELGLLVDPASGAGAHSRRSVLRAGVVAGAAVGFGGPVIRSIVAPTPAQAVSLGCVGPCATAADCTPPGLCACVNGFCSPLG